jgi:hyperosmotically inducible periplasmic protein
MIPRARSTASLLVVALALAGCSSRTGESVGRSVDDATIAAAVKSKLAAEGVAPRSRVDVDASRGTVYLAGTVDSAAVRARAGIVAGGVRGVREVVNDLKVQRSR